MARQRIWMRVWVLVLVVSVLQPWPASQSLARQSPAPATQLQPAPALPAAQLQPAPARPAQQLAASFPPEITGLAAGLENDPLAIYDHVYNQIDYLPSWGLMQSPRETLLAGAGSAFDQAALLAALLNAAGYSTQYVRGNINLTPDQAMNWTGAADVDAATQILLAGGTQVTLVGDLLRIPHVWVRLSAGGSHDLDPSFKTYLATPGQDLHPLLGFDQATFIARAQAGASITANSAQQLNRANITADAASYAANLVGYLRANAPFASVEDLIGGRRIVPRSSAGYPTPPYTIASSATAANLNNTTYALRVQLAGIDVTLTTESLDGQRLTIFYECASPADCQTLQAAGGIFGPGVAGTVNMLPRLRLGGQVIGTGAAAALGTRQQLLVQITTPAPISQSFTLPRELDVGGWYALPTRLHGVSGRSLASQIDLLDAATAQGLPLDDERVLGQILHVIGLSYYHEVGLGSQIDSRLARVAIVPGFSAMVASRDIRVFTDLAGDPVEIAPGSHTVDLGLNVDNAVALASDANAANRERAWFLSAGLRGSAAEHAIVEQLQPVPAISTVQILNHAAASGDTIYYITPANQGAIVPLLDQQVAQSIAPSLQIGRHVVVHRQVASYEQWSGTGWIELNPTTGEAGYLILGGIGPGLQAQPLAMRGGSGALPTAPATSAEAQPRADAVQLANQRSLNLDLNRIANTPHMAAIMSNMGRAIEQGDPINGISGAFEYRHDDMAGLGGLGLPLRFTRFYSSAAHSSGGALGFGWSHSYSASLSRASEWARGFGSRTAVEAAPALAAAQIAVDLFTAASIPQQHFAIDAIVSQWLMARVTANAITISDPSGALLTYVRLIDGAYLAPAGAANLAGVSFAGDDSATAVWEGGAEMHFDPSGRLSAHEDANNNRTSLSYDGQGRLAQVTDAVGRTLSLSYDGQGRLSQLLDPAGRAYSYGYDAAGNLTSATDPRGGVTSYGYDGAHRLTSVIDPLGTTFVASQYDELGRVSQQTNGRGALISLHYGGDRTLVIDPLGRRSRLFYDERGQLLAAQNGLGVSHSFTYDAAGNLTGQRDGLGNAYSFVYDSRGRLTTISDPLNQTSSWAYDASGNPASFTDQRGKSWQFSYNSQHNLTGVTDPVGVVTSYTYSGLGQLTAVGRAGESSTLGYDGQGNLSYVQNGLGQQRSWTYDNIGRPTSYSDGSGAVTKFAYDGNDNLIGVTDPAGGTTSYSYDGNNILTAATDPNQHTTSYSYDAQFNLTGVTDALGVVTSYIYDAADQLTRIVDGNGHATTYSYDAAGRVIGRGDPLGRTVSYSYDNADRLTGLARADGSNIGYQYDALGRLTAVDNPGGADNSYSYDPAGNLIGAAAGPAWSASYSYDEAGRLNGASEPGRGLSLSYSYNPAGRLAGVVAQRATTTIYQLSYSYDAAGRLVSLSDPLSGATIELGYDGANRLAQIVDPSGARALYSYAAGRLAQIEHLSGQGDPIASYDYSYDPAGNITSITDTTAAGSFTTGYSYDGLDRLIGESYPRYAISYSYDAVGNLVRRVDPRDSLDYSYDAADQLTGRGDERFSYDPNGNLTSWESARGTATYGYNGQGQLTSMSRSDGTSLAFSYDAFARRLTTQDPGGARGFLYSGQELIVEGSADLAQATARYLHGGGMLLARADDQVGLSTYHGDGRASTRYLLGAEGLPIDGYSYDGLGGGGLPGGVDANPYRFVGQRGVYRQDVPGWPYLHMGYRHYDPDSGRFTTRDPLRGDLLRPISQNAYLHGLANPSYIDPSGLRPFPTTFAAIQPASAISGPLPASPDPFGGAKDPFLTSFPLQSGSPVAPLGARLPSIGQHQADQVPRWAVQAPLDARLASIGQALRLLHNWLRKLWWLQPDPDGPISPPISPAIEDFQLVQRGPGRPQSGPAQNNWQRLTSRGSVFALACTANNQLLAGSFHAGLQRSTGAGHLYWSDAAPAGVATLAIGADGLYAGARYAGVLKSDDGGAWAPADRGLAANDVYALAVDPNTPGRIFAGTEMGLFVSGDAGANWARPAGSPPGRVVSELAFAGGALLAVTDVGLYRSLDAGASWSRPATDLPAVPVYTLLAGGQAVYAGTALGAYRSADGGDSWQPLGAELAGRSVHALAIDPQNGARLVAGTRGGLFISDNEGESWTPATGAGLSGPASQVGALAFCPKGGDMELYAGTGAGVYALAGQRAHVYLPLVMK